MRAVRMLARCALRQRWRSVIVLTLLAAFAGAVVLALVAGARRTETSLARFERESRSADVEFDAGDVTPAQVDELRRTPGVAVIALVAVGLALVSSLRRRRRELAVLKTLGFTRRQVRATVAWQASTVAAVGLVIGIPLGLLVGTYVWRRVADELGVSSEPTWRLLGIVLLAVGALVAVNLIAAVPARRSARTRPAVVLRSE